MSNQARARELFSEGYSVNAVAKQLGITWAEAKKFKPAEDDQQDETSSAENDAGLVYTVNLEIPTGRTMELLRALAVDELLGAIEDLDESTQIVLLENVLQRRLNGALELPAVAPIELPHPRLQIAN